MSDYDDEYQPAQSTEVDYFIPAPPSPAAKAVEWAMTTGTYLALAIALVGAVVVIGGLLALLVVLSADHCGGIPWLFNKPGFYCP